MNAVPRWLRDDSAFFTRPVRVFETYCTAFLRADLLAGLTVAVVMLPQAIAYAMIAELPPQTGLYAAIVASIVGALWGSSRHLHTGPTNAASLLALATLLNVAAPGTPEFLVAAGYLALMVGIVKILAGLARMGALVNFVSDSVVVGFTAGAGVLIGVNQLRHLLRLDIKSSPKFIETVEVVTRHLYETHLPSLALGLGTLALIIIIKRLRPRWPAALLSMVASAACVWAFDLVGKGVRVLGELPRSLPPLADLPLLDADLIFKLAPGAMAIAAIGLVEAMSIARAVASQSGQRIDSNQEFVGQGLASVAAGLFSGYPVSGSFTRSSINYGAGALTSLSSIFSGLWVLAAMLLLAPLAVFLPNTALAAVLLVTAHGMVDWHEIGRITKMSRGDSTIMFSTITATLIFPLEFAVLSGMLISFARFLVTTSAPAVQSLVPDSDFVHLVPARTQPVCPQLAVVEVEGPLYFGAVNHIEESLDKLRRGHPGQIFLLLRLGLVDHVDVSGIHMLESVLRRYRKRGGDMFVEGARPRVLYMMHQSGFLRTLGRDNLMRSGNIIGELFHHVLHPGICIYECEHRVFAECQALPKHSESIDHELIGGFARGPVPEILPSEVKLALDESPDSVVLVDVSETREYERWHIREAASLPLPRLTHDDHGLERERKLVLVSRIGRRSELALRILRGHGYTNAYNMKGGMLAWEAAGYPIAVE
ncbi:STAS domain-containing protein [bacterium]|nr:STAS domain-containing protein [bacterium]MBU1675494.1 STAS domain-containing protein [bacterium]